METAMQYAPGWPGIPPRWNSSNKSGVGTSLNRSSEIWFTTSHGILNEVFYPRVDIACIRDMGFLVGNGKDFFSEEKRHTVSRLSYPVPSVPLYHFTNTCRQGRYRIEKTILTDPFRNSLLQELKFIPLEGKREDYQLYALLAPHIMNAGWGNTAWYGEYKGTPMLFASRDGAAVALCCSVPYLRRSVGFVGSSDAWQDISVNKRLTRLYERAENGNVALCGEIDLAAAGDAPFLVVTGFGRNAHEAGQRALASLCDGFEKARDQYVQGWQEWQSGLLPLPAGKKAEHDLYRVSTAVILSHEAPQFPGGFLASLSVPWGTSKGDDDLGGYHLVWPRDLVETAGGLLAAGAGREALRVLDYLRVTQEADGHWQQNMWLDGTPYWQGLQLDETAFPVVLLNLLCQQQVLAPPATAPYLPMLRQAIRFILRNGPCSPEDRWEENSGYSPFTLATVITALLAAADLLEATDGEAAAAYLRHIADAWNEMIESWTYVSDTPLSRSLGISGYYVRIAPPDVDGTDGYDQEMILIKNLPTSEYVNAARIVSPDALALVRFGLRAADDKRITDTLVAIDALLKVETPFGDCWHRYNEDGYGEHADGAPFDGAGTGRAWPLLTGERAHYELAAGNRQRAETLLETMGLFAGEGGMLPEQIWDAAAIPERELFPGRPAGSAMPLVWAHSEYIKLVRSLRDGRVFDLPEQTRRRYLEKGQKALHTLWRFRYPVTRVEKGKILRVEAGAPLQLHWSVNAWLDPRDTPGTDSGWGRYYVDIPTAELEKGTEIFFTFFWPEANRWEGNDFCVTVV
ncbi:glucan 1,4-alpha-glucosidase [Compostibacter hankyongensis]|uniref:Glucan 1,4-alpha-glucosidase n=1 Tax=Compostibacter hankyongensis TaxID=1007089 RepID=A0ABP8FUP3_9BACT